MRFAIALDMTVADMKRLHPKGSRRAYDNIAVTIGRFGFERVQWSVYAAGNEDLANLYCAIEALKALEWFGPSVKNVRAFRMEQGSDFTAVVKGTTA